MSRKDKLKRLWTLFFTSFITSLTANSGYAILSVLRTTYTKKHEWITEEEMTDIIALCQVSPGPIAINASVMLGYQCAGGLGSFLSVLGCVIPPIMIMVLVTIFYNVIVENKIVALFMRGMQAGVIAMLLDVVISLFGNIKNRKSIYLYVILIGSFLFLRLTDLSVFILLVIVLAAALVKTFIMRKKTGGNHESC